VIWEAFKPESEPRRTGSVAGAGDGKAGGPTRRVRSDAEFMKNAGGIY
jgi:penicillin-binding protein 1A